MRISELKIDPDFRDCLPKLTDEEFEQLERNIVEYGVQMPLIIWNGYVVDGHNRYTVCFNHGIKEVPVREEYFENKDDALRWILENQLGRRNLTDFGRNEVALRYKAVIARKAKERQIESGKRYGRGMDEIGSGQMTTTFSEETGRTREEIAKIAGTNGTSVRRTEFILKNGTAEEIDRARQGGKGNSQGTITEEIKKRIAPEGTKVCSTCGEVKPLSEFGTDKSRVDGLNLSCKDCLREREHKPRNSGDTGISTEEIIAEMYSDEIKQYTPEMLIAEVTVNSESYVRLLRNMISDRVELLDDKTKRGLRDAIEEIVHAIHQVEEELL